MLLSVTRCCTTPLILTVPLPLGAVFEDAYLRVLDLCATISCDAGKTCEPDYLSGTASCVCPECDTTFDVICGKFSDIKLQPEITEH